MTIYSVLMTTSTVHLCAGKIAKTKKKKKKKEKGNVSFYCPPVSKYLSGNYIVILVHY